MYKPLKIKFMNLKELIDTKVKIDEHIRTLEHFEGNIGYYIGADFYKLGRAEDNIKKVEDKLKIKITLPRITG